MLATLLNALLTRLRPHRTDPVALHQTKAWNPANKWYSRRWVPPHVFAGPGPKKLLRQVADRAYRRRYQRDSWPKFYHQGMRGIPAMSRKYRRDAWRWAGGYTRRNERDDS